MATLSNSNKGAKRHLLQSASTVALALVAMAGAAAANDYTVNGGAAVNFVAPFSYLAPFATPVDVVVNINSTADSAGQIIFNTQGPIGPSTATSTLDLTVTSGTDVVSAGHGIWTPAYTSDLKLKIDGRIDAAANGLLLDTYYYAGDDSITVSGAGSIKSGAIGIEVIGDAGITTIDGIVGGINSGSTGIYVHNFLGLNATATAVLPSGDINIGQTTPIGDIVAGVHGIHIVQPANLNGDSNINITTNKVTAVGAGFLVNNSFTGDTTITTKGLVDAGTEGLYVNSTTGNLTFNIEAGIDAGTEGIEASSTTGDIVADGKGTSAIDAGGYGTYLVSNGGDVTVKAFAGGIDAGVDAVWVGAGNGSNVAVKDNGALTGLEGIEVLTAGTDDTNGNITITDNTSITGTLVDAVRAYTSGGGNIYVKDNGTVNGLQDGLELLTVSSDGTNGNITVTGNGDIMGQTVDGIRAWTSLGGDVLITTAGDVTGLNNGIGALTNDDGLGANGNITINVSAGDTVKGQAYGIVTANILGTATTNNLGTIKDTTDTGAPDDGTSGDAYLSLTGNGELNNEAGGVVTGRVHSAGTSFTMENKAGSIWNVGLLSNSFATANDVVNNAGLMNIRTGVTTLAALENLNNKSGGIIDMTYGDTVGASEATDSLVIGGDFAPEAGSVLKVDFDPTLANNTGTGPDASSNGLGAADTVFALTVTPTAKSDVAITTIGDVSVQNGQHGSVSIIREATFKGDPGANGAATMVDSSFYNLVNDPSTGAVLFKLVDSGDGGVELQWAPNVTADNLLGGAGPAASRIAGAAGSLAGMGAALSGGPNGGGVAGGVADSASSAASNSQNCVVSKDSLSDAYSNANHAWLSGTGSHSSFDGGGTGWDLGTAVGFEHDLGAAAGVGCGTAAVGLFANFGAYGSDSDTNAVDGMARGGGIYAKAASQSGVYVSILGGVNWSDTDLTTKFLSGDSTANQDSLGSLGTASLGFTDAISDSVDFDARVYGTMAHVDGDGYTNSAGLVVDGTTADVMAAGFMVGLSADTSASTSTFIRGGGKWMSADQSATSLGITVESSDQAFVSSLEAGFAAQLSDRATLSGSTFGDYTVDSLSYGANLSLAFKL